MTHRFAGTAVTVLFLVVAASLIVLLGVWVVAGGWVRP